MSWQCSFWYIYFQGTTVFKSYLALGDCFVTMNPFTLFGLEYERVCSNMYSLTLFLSLQVFTLALLIVTDWWQWWLESNWDGSLNAPWQVKNEMCETDYDTQNSDCTKPGYLSVEYDNTRHTFKANDTIDTCKFGGASGTLFVKCMKPVSPFVRRLNFVFFFIPSACVGFNCFIMIYRMWSVYMAKFKKNEMQTGWFWMGGTQPTDNSCLYTLWEVLKSVCQLLSISRHADVTFHFGDQVFSNPPEVKQKLQADVAAYQGNIWCMIWIAFIVRLFLVICKFVYGLRQWFPIDTGFKCVISFVFVPCVLTWCILSFFNSKWWFGIRRDYRIFVYVCPVPFIMCVSSTWWSYWSWSIS